VYRNLVPKYLREYEPVKRTIFVRGDRDRALDEYFVQFPTTLFGLTAHGFVVAFSDKPVASLDDTVYCPCIPNAHGNAWWICGCQTSSISHSIEVFWTSAFRREGTPGNAMLRKMFPPFLPRTIKQQFNITPNFENWEKMSAKKNGLKKIIRRMKKKSWFNLFSRFRQPLHRFLDYGYDGYRHKVNFSAEYE
jgi:hypothetical protein